MSEQLPFGSRGGIAVGHYFPVDGEYTLKIRLQKTFADAIRGLGEPNQLEVRLDRARLKLFTIGGDGPRAPFSSVASPTQYEQTADAGLEVRVPLKAGTHLVAATFLKKSSAPEGVLEPRLSVSTYTYAGDRDAEMGVDSIQIHGPYSAKAPEETPSRRQIFLCYPVDDRDEEPCAGKILSNLARRAYRRPASDQDIQTLLRFYRTGRSKWSFEER